MISWLIAGRIVVELLDGSLLLGSLLVGYVVDSGVLVAFVRRIQVITGIFRRVQVSRLLLLLLLLIVQVFAQVRVGALVDRRCVVQTGLLFLLVELRLLFTQLLQQL